MAVYYGDITVRDREKFTDGW